MKLATGLNRGIRHIQNLLGPAFTEHAMASVGEEGTRFVRELLGRSARHRTQVVRTKEVIGPLNSAWTICPDQLNKDSIVYSIGIGRNLTFDMALIERFGVNVFAFDPTPESVLWMKSQTNLPGTVHFFDWGLAEFDGFASFALVPGTLTQYAMSSVVAAEAGAFKVHKLQTIMKKLAHQRIDLLKVNIEGGEYRIIDDIARCPIDQLVIEFHHRLPGFSLSQTKIAVKKLNKHGYRIFHISDGKEYSFVREPPTDWKSDS